MVDLAPEDQLIPYTVTDVDGQSATAVIWVPGQGEQYPTLAKTDVVEVMAGKDDHPGPERLRPGPGRPHAADHRGGQGPGAGRRSAERDGRRAASALRYAALKDYVGPGSITFEVTDGAGPDDPQGLKSTLSIMTKVIPDPERQPPAHVQRRLPGGSQGRNRHPGPGNLAKDVDERDQENLRFELDGTLPEGFKASAGRCHPESHRGLRQGCRLEGQLPLKVTDGRSEPVTATIAATVVASNRPLPVANDDVVEKANAGKTETVNVLANDFNPFSETPLRIVGATVETGSAAGQPAVAGDSITVTPADGFKGVMVVRYTVMDKTGDLSRQTDGRVRITVRDKPDAPSAPAATDVRSRTAVLKWAPPSDNGATITKYTVRSATGSARTAPPPPAPSAG